MQLVQLNTVPSQQFNIPLGGNNYTLKIYSIDGAMAYDLDINAINIISGFEMVNDVPLLVYPHQEVNGNLLLAVPESEIPDYTRFGSSQFLYYLTADEAAAYRAVTDL